MAEIVLDRVTKTYGDGTRAVSEVELVIPDGSFAVLVGPSGCGKTSLLRMIAGLETISDGRIVVGGREVNDVRPKDRDIAMVFQNYALYPHMTVYDNMAFGLKLRKTPRAEVDARVQEAARILGIEDQLKKKPGKLSGGQRQRVAMGRAIVREPQAFLMDEPLSNLDSKLRVQMRAEIARLQKHLAVTTIYVTHDQTEAMTLGDRVAVMRKGVVVQVDDPEVLYARPATLFVAGFIGSPAMNLAYGTVSYSASGATIEIAGTRLDIDREALVLRPALRQHDGREVIVGIRPDDLSEARADTPAGRRLQGLIDLRESHGSDVFVHFLVDSRPVVTDDTRELAVDTDSTALHDLESENAATTFIARMHPRTQVREGETVELAVDTRALHFFDPASGEGIFA